MNYLHCLLLLLICFGCKKEESKPKIEIYLLNKTIESNEGILFSDTPYYANLDSIERKWYQEVRFDTIRNELIYAGKFTAAKDDLQDYPFIKNEEILGFNKEEDILIFDTIVKRRLHFLFPGKQKVQFAIAIDKKPVLFGYIWWGMWSRFPYTYNFYTSVGDYDFKDKPGEQSYMLEYGPPKNWGRDQLERPSYNQNLTEAFRLSGRLRK